MTYPNCKEKITITRFGRISPYPHYDIYYECPNRLECPNRCIEAFHIQIEPPDEELMNEFRLSTKERSGGENE